MAALAILPGDVADVDSVLRRFAEFEAILRDEVSAAVVAEQLGQAKLLQSAVRIRKMAARVGHAAFRLEAHALRRLYALGARNMAQFGTGSALTQGAKFSKLTDIEFEELLESGISSCSALYHSIRQIEASAKHQQEIVEGEKVPSELQRPSGTEDLKAAAASILSQITESGEPFTLTEAANSLLDLLDIDRDDMGVIAARELVRDALRSPERGRAMDEGFPDVVTFQEDGPPGGRWWRIPINHATAAQLTWMAEFRARQAEEMGRVAWQLGKAANEVELAAAAAGIDSEDFKVTWLWYGVPEAVA